MALLANTLATDGTTFDDWRIRTNDTIERLNSITIEGNTVTVNTATANTLNVTSVINLGGVPITTTFAGNVYVVATYAVNATIYTTFDTKAANTVVQDHVLGNDNVHNLTSNVAGVADVQTLSNKTIVEPVMAGNLNFITATGNGSFRRVFDGGRRVVTQGLHSLWLAAGGFTPHVTNGAISSVFQTATSQIVWRVLNFTPSAITRAQSTIAFPASYDKGTLSGEIFWYSNTIASSGNTAWAVRAVAISHDDNIGPTFGAFVYTNGLLTAVDDLQVTTFSGLTVGGTPANGDLTVLEIIRDYANATDTCTSNAIFAGVKVLYTIDAPNDA